VIDQVIDLALDQAAVDLLVRLQLLWEGTEAVALVGVGTSTAKITSDLVAVAPLFFVV